MDQKKKVVLNLEIHEDKSRQKAMKLVSSLQGIESISMDMKERKLTVIGDVDPVCVVRKLRKSFCAKILTVGPAKEPEKPKPLPQPEVVIIDCYNNPYPKYPICCVEENPNVCVIS